MASSPPASVRTAVLASGSGTNFEALVEAQRRGDIAPAEIVLLVADRPDAPALERARRLGVESAVVDRRSFAEREAFDAALVDALRARGAELILFAGFMRVVGRAFLDAFPGRVLNLHPSLLPAFPGRRAIADALAADASETGATVHFVDEGIDAGPILLRERVAIQLGDDHASLAARVRVAEHRLLPLAARLVASGEAWLDGAAVRFREGARPGAAPPPSAKR